MLKKKNLFILLLLNTIQNPENYFPGKVIGMIKTLKDGVQNWLKFSCETSNLFGSNRPGDGLARLFFNIALKCVTLGSIADAPRALAQVFGVFDR